MLLMHWTWRADSRAWANTGKRMAARMAMMAITTSSSIRVKPRLRSWETVVDGPCMADLLRSTTRRRAGDARHQVRNDDDGLGGGRRGLAGEQVHHRAELGFEVLIHRGQRRDALRAHGKRVVAGHGDLLRDPDAGALEDAQEGDRFAV